MKKRELFFKIFSVVFLSVILFSCKTSEDITNSKKITIIIEPEYSTMTQWYSPEPVKCLAFKEEGNNEVYKIMPNSIEGFEYKPGYTWKLKVKKETLKNPPADASNIRYKLVNVISKTTAK